ncbi:MAG: DUF697 domain-containing protein [Saprospiraceae bacterium]
MTNSTEVSNQVEQIQLRRLDEPAMGIIRKFTLIAAGGGLIPLAAVSATANTGIQVMMIKELCQLFNVQFDGKVATTVVTAVIGSAIIQGASIAVSGGIPGVVNPTKGISGAILAGVYTATVGEFYKVHFQKGGTLEDASLLDIGKYFKAEIDNGDISVSNIANPMSFAKRIFNLG